MCKHNHVYRPIQTLNFTSHKMFIKLTCMTLSLPAFLLQSQPSPKQSEYMARSTTSTSSHASEVSNIIRHVCIRILLLNILTGQVRTHSSSLPHDNTATRMSRYLPDLQHTRILSKQSKINNEPLLELNFDTT